MTCNQKKHIKVVPQPVRKHVMNIEIRFDDIHDKRRFLSRIKSFSQVNALDRNNGVYKVRFPKKTKFNYKYETAN